LREQSENVTEIMSVISESVFSCNDMLNLFSHNCPLVRASTPNRLLTISAYLFSTLSKALLLSIQLSTIVYTRVPISVQRGLTTSSSMCTLYTVPQHIEK